MTIRLILGDQLNLNHSWFSSVSEDVMYVLMEMHQETGYTRHHVQKVVAFFLAMREFAKSLEDAGHRVLYLHLDEAKNTGSLTENLQRILDETGANTFEYQLPDEYRLDEQLKAFTNTLSIDTAVHDSEHFITQREDLANHFEGKKMFLMENFYRKMRKKHGILMDGDDPVTGQWNYDKSNRKKLPKDHRPPEPMLWERNVEELVQMLKDQNVETIGRVDAKAFSWPVTCEEGVALLDYFCETLLPHFGDFQDALTTEYWSLYHSRLSFLINVKILSPMEVIKAVEAKWRSNPDHADIAQVEGFIRQILGWREYMRGIYWAKMPEFASMNYFEHERDLPSWFWTGNTKMKCLSHSINQSLEFAYAHHIQRLMVTGNFALLAGIHPDEVDQWYLGIYIDAIEWVEITNTRGMSQFADGGIVGTKPYVSSANYMHKMGNYCSQCQYDRQAKVGEKACPFNSLYWHFYNRHADKLERNPRIGMMYRTWNKMAPEKRAELIDQAEYYLENIEEL